MACRPCGPSLRSQSPWSQDRSPGPACSPEWRLSLCVLISYGWVHLCFSIAGGSGCLPPSDLTVLDLRSIALKAWCLDVQNKQNTPLFASAPSEETQPRPPWRGAVCVVTCRASLLCSMYPGRQALQLLSWEGNSLVRWRPHASGRSRVPAASHRPALTSVPS